MHKFLAVAVGLLLACPAPTRAGDAVTPDVAAKKVLEHYGLNAEILRPYSRLRKTSSRKDGRFLLRFDGDPGMQVLFDRDYWVIVSRPTKEGNDVFAYMFNPQDEQSALNISLGRDIQSTSGSASKEPGFSGFASGDGVVGGQKIRWRRWSDDEHLHSDCTLTLPVPDGNGAPDRKVNIAVTANTAERRRALEESMASLELLPARK